jgi:DNA-binding IclR family transcriptional regulator
VLDAPLRRVARETVTGAAELRRILTRIRRDGYVIAPGSIEAVSTGVAVPLREEGEVIAALSVVLPRDADAAPTLAPLRKAAAEIEARLRGTRA